MKKLNIIIETCDQCPYCVYNGDYNIGYDSGHDCSQTGNRIYNDNEVAKFYNKRREYKKSLNTLFPMDKSEEPEIPWKIPEWCPLEDVNNTNCNYSE